MAGTTSTQSVHEYVIVDFPEENKDGIISMALISSTWLFEKNGATYCYWPTYLRSTLSREKAVRNHSPLITEKCVTCLVIVKQHDINYEKASSKLKRLEEESELSSNTDSECGQRFIRYSNRDSDFIYDGDQPSDEDDNDIPVPPKFESSQVRKLTTLKPVRHQNHVNDMSPMPVSQLHQEEPSNSLNISPSSEPEPTQKCQCAKSINIMERMLRDLQILKNDVSKLVKMANNDKYTQYEMLDSQLSFKKYEELQNFNQKLGEEDYFNKIMASVCLLGGRDVAETTRKIVSILVSHELVLKLNWIGVNEKGSFQKLDKVLRVIYGAVRRNPVCSNATNFEIDQSIRNWIKNAPDREGGRASRKKK